MILRFKLTVQGIQSYVDAVLQSMGYYWMHNHSFETEDLGPLVAVMSAGLNWLLVRGHDARRFLALGDLQNPWEIVLRHSQSTKHHEDGMPL